MTNGNLRTPAMAAYRQARIRAAEQAQAQLAMEHARRFLEPLHLVVNSPDGREIRCIALQWEAFAHQVAGPVSPAASDRLAACAAPPMMASPALRALEAVRSVWGRLRSAVKHVAASLRKRCTHRGRPLQRGGWRLVDLAAGTACLLALSFVPPAQAATGTYSNTASGGLWSDSGNWASGTIADGATFTANFNALDITADNTVHLDTSRTIGNLTFGDTNASSAASWVLDNNGVPGNVLNLGSGSGGTITTSPALGAGQTVTISATINAGSGNINVNNGQVIFSGTAANSGGLVVYNGASVTLNKPAGVNAVTGNVQLGQDSNYSHGGSLYLGASEQIANTSILRLYGAHYSGAAAFYLNGYNETIGGVFSQLRWSTSAPRIYNGGLTDSTLTLDLATGTTQKMGNPLNAYGKSQYIRDGGLGKLNLVKTGSGTQIIGDTGVGTTMDYTGTTTVNAGTLTLVNLNFNTSATTVTGGTLSFQSASASAPITLAGGNLSLQSSSLNGPVTGGSGQVLVVGGTNSNFGSVPKTYAVDTVLSGASTSLTQTVANTFSPNSVHNIGAGASLITGNFAGSVKAIQGAGTVNLNGAAANLIVTDGSGQTFSGNLTGAGSLTKNGTGTQILSGASDYTGATVVNAGVLRLDFAAGGTSNIGSASSAVVFGGGTLEVRGGAGEANTQTFNGVSGSGTLQITQNGAASVNVTVGAVAAGSSINFVGSDATVGGLGSANFLTTSTTAGNNGTTRLGANLWNGTNWASTSSTGGNHVVQWVGTYTDIYNGTNPGPVAIPTGAPAADVRIQQATSGITNNTLASSATIGSLLMNAGIDAATVNLGANTLTVDSGAVAIASGAKSLTLGAAANDGVITSGSSAAPATLFLNNQNAAATLTVNSVIANNGSGGAVSVVKAGPGVATLAGANTYTGSTSVTGGTLRLQSVAAPAAPAGAAAIYTFNSFSGSTINNGGALGAAYNGTLSNSSLALGSGPNGGNAMNLSNANGEMLITLNSGHGVSLAGGNWTASVWFNGLYANTTWRTLFRGNTGDHEVIVQSGGDNLGWYQTPGAGFQSSGYTGLTKDTYTGWHQLTAVGSASGTIFYIDGAQVATTANRSVADIYSVGNYQGGGQPFASLLSDVYVYQSALTPAQVLQLYQANAAAALPMHTPVSITGGGTLDVNGLSPSLGSLSGDATATLALGGGVITVGSNNSSTTYSGVISDTGGAAVGTGGQIVKVGTGMLTLDGPASNTFSGDTTVMQGSLSLAKTGGAKALGGNLVFNNNLSPDVYTLADNQFAAGAVVSFVNNSGDHGRLDLMGTTQTVAGIDTASYTSQRGVIQNSEAIPNAGNSTLILDGSGNYTFGGYLRGQTGVLGLVKDGTGTQTFTNSGISYNGGTTLNAGTLNFNTGNTSISGVMTFNGGTLQHSSAAYLVQNGPVVVTADSVINSTGAGTTSSQSQAYFQAGFNIDSGKTLTVNTGLNNGIVLRGSAVGGGSLQVNGAGTTSNAGRANVQFGTSGATALANIDVTLNNATMNVGKGSNGDANTANGATLKNLNGNGRVVSDNQAGTLTVGANDGSGSFAGVLANGNNILSLTKIGSGTQALTGVNLYSGPTTVSGGTLVVGVNGLGSINSSAVTVQSGGRLAGNGSSGSVTVEDGGTHAPGNSPGIFTVNGSYALNGDLALEFKGAGLAGAANGYSQVHVTGTGAGSVDLQGSSTLTINYTGGANNFNPAFAQVFTLIDHDGNTSTDTTGMFSNYPAEGANVMIDGKQLKLYYHDGGSPDQNNVVLVSNYGSTTGATLYVNNEWTSAATVNGDLESGGPAAFVGVNAFASPDDLLAAYSNFTGNVVVNGGTYTSALLAGGGDIQLQLVNDTVNNQPNVTLGTLTGDAGDGISTQYHNAPGVGNLTVQDGSFAGQISGGGDLAKTTSGTLILNGTNTYAGTTTISGGTLQIGSGGGTGSLGSGNVINDASLVFDRSNTYSVGNAISGAGTVDQVGSGTTRFSGGATNTYTGVTTVSSGTLDLARTGGGNKSIAGDGVAITPDLVINGGTVRISASEQIADNARVDLSSGSFLFNGSGLTETIGSFTNSGGVFSTNGANTLIGAGNTITWAGGTNTITAGGLVQDNDWVISGGTNTVEGGPAGTLQVQTGGSALHFSGTGTHGVTLNSDATSPGRLLLQDNVFVDNGGLTGTVQILSGGNAATPGTIDLDNDTRTFDVINGTASIDMRISARIANGALTKTGNGTLQLTGDNTFTGATIVNGGTLELAAPGVLQNGSIEVNAGAFLQSGGTNHVTGAGPSAGNLTVNGGVYRLNGGTLDFQDYSAGGASTWTPAANQASTISLTTGADFEFTGGTLLDVSNINTTGGAGTFTQNGGTFVIGQDGAGPAALTTVNGGYSLIDGVLRLDAFGPDLTPEICCDGVPGNNDQLVVGGNVLLDSEIALNFVNGYEPQFGDVLTLICAENITLDDHFSLTGGYFRLVPTGLGEGQPQYALQAIVPEPASVAVWSLVLVTGAAAAFRRRRRRSESQA